MPPEVPYSRPLLTPLVHFSAPVSPGNNKYFRGNKRMKTPGKKLIPLLVFIITSLSILRLLRLAITTTSPSPPSSTLLPTLQKICSSTSPSCSNAPSYSPGTSTNLPNAAALTKKEFKLLSNLITSKAPCNLLIFGLDPQYKLLKHARKNPACAPRSELLPSSKCKLTLKDIPQKVFKHKWDVILVDGPSGDMLEAPGRMSTIYTASMLARNGNTTDVLVHDIDRTVEKWFSWEFLCEENLVSSKGKLWNFRLTGQSNSTRFCPAETILIE